MLPATIIWLLFLLNIYIIKPSFFLYFFEYIFLSLLYMVWSFYH